MAALLAEITSASAQCGPENMIPVPAHYELTGGTVSIAEKSVDKNIGGKFLKKIKAFNLAPWQQKSAYSLEISKKGIKIEAADEEGIFYALQSLKMLSSLSSETSCCKILDWPRFSYRGLMLDVSRNFQPKEFIEKQLDMMAMLKMNKFHFHLVDDPGWRIQIDKYPMLTCFSAWRSHAEWSDWTKDMAFRWWNDPEAYGGFYTKKDIAEIVGYAAALHIEVIPEIEMPGHNLETIASYPELACMDSLGTGHLKGVHELCPSSDLTYTFLTGILSEVFEMFPSKYIHIGGDEAGKDNWAKCPVCQETMKKEGLGSLEELQSRLIKKIEKFANEHGKTIIGWDEILEGGLSPNATVMSWRGTEGGLKAIAAGHDVIMSPTTYVYLDYHQAKDNYRGVGPYLPLEKTYSYDPADPMIDSGNMHHLLGVQGNMWTEWVHTPQHVEYQIYPRILAVAEIGWSQPADKNYSRFRENAVQWLKVMDGLRYSHYDLEHEVKE